MEEKENINDYYDGTDIKGGVKHLRILITAIRKHERNQPFHIPVL